MAKATTTTTSSDDFFKNIIKQVDDYADLDDTIEFVDTGSYVLNGLMSGTILGGFAKGKVTCLAGEESTGKSFFAISFVKSFLDNNPNGRVIYFDTEFAQQKADFIKRGIDMDRCSILKITTVEEFRNKAITILNGYEKVKDREKTPMMFVLDSLGQLQNEGALEKLNNNTTNFDRGLHAKLLKAVFAGLTRPLGLLQVPLIVTNHIYTVAAANPMAQPTKVITGGSGLKYTTSSIVMLSKYRIRDDVETSEFSGVRIVAQNSKSRFAKEGKKVDIVIDFAKGLDRYTGLLDFAVKYGIIEVVSKSFYLLPNDEKKYRRKEIEANPSKFFTKEILEKLDEKFQENFSYGASGIVFEDEADTETLELLTE